MPYSQLEFPFMATKLTSRRTINIPMINYLNAFLFFALEFFSEYSFVLRSCITRMLLIFISFSSSLFLYATISFFITTSRTIQMGLLFAGKFDGKFYGLMENVANGSDTL